MVVCVKNADIWDLPVGKDKILSPLMLSYGYLPCNVKQCFAFCAIYLKDYVMNEEMLIQLWMANGFISSQGGAEPEVEGHNIFNELVWRSFLQDVQQQRKRDGDCHLSYTTCKMHDLMHDLAQSIMQNECFAMLEFSDLEVPNKIRHLSLHTQLMESYASSKVNTFLPSLHTYIETEGNFHRISDVLSLHKAKYLRAVKLSYLPSPFPVENWKSLKYLNLKNSGIFTLPESICMLFNLQTLRLSGCRRLRELPSGMRKMCNLRHLFLDKCYIKKMPSRMGKLSNMRTLTNYIVGSSNEGRGIGELNSLNLGGQLVLEDLGKVKSGAEAKEARLNCKQNLHVLKLRWGTKFLGPSLQVVGNSEEVLEALEPPSSLKILKIWNYVGIQYPRWMRDPILLRNMVEIKITYCNGCERLPPFGQLPLLEVLTLGQLDAVKYICKSSSEEPHDNVQGWPSLKRLELLTMQNLEGWWEEDGCAAADYDLLFFPCLTDLIIRGCPKLKTMPKCCTSIQNFEITGSETACFLNSRTRTFELHLKKGCSGSNEMQPLQCLQRNGLLFKNPKFTKHLGIRGDAEVMELLLLNEEETGLFFTSFEELSIDGCNGLFYVEPPSLRLGLWKKLTCLQDLRIENCDALVYWPEKELRGLNSSLKRLTFRDCRNLTGPSKSSLECGPMDKLDSLRISNCNVLAELPKFPTSLGELAILNCPNLTSFVFEGPGGSLLDLASLQISDCAGLVKLPKFPASLEELKIGDCRTLTSLVIEGPEGPLMDLKSLVISQFDGLVEMSNFPASLRELKIVCCRNLMSLVIEGAGGPLLDLKSLEITSCDRLVELLKFPASVRNLEIYSCKRLRSLMTGGPGESLELQTLHIRDCPRLVCFSETFQQQLPKLQKLKIWECPDLEKLC